MASQELWDAIDSFDYKEYLRRKGISEDKIPESLDDSRKAALFKAANDDYFASLVEQYKSDPFMKKADAEDKAREKLLEGRPWIRPLYGLWEEEKSAEELYSPDTVLAEVIRRNNITPSANGSINTQNFTPELANKEINDVIEQYAEAITSRPGLKYDAPELDGVSKSKFIEEFKYRNGLSNFETVKSFIDLYQRQRVQRLREQREADPNYNWQAAALKEGTIGGWEMLGTAMQYWGDVFMNWSDSISDSTQQLWGVRFNQRVDRTDPESSLVLRMRNKGIQWRDEAKNDRAKHGYIPRYDGTLQDYWNEGGPWAKALWEQALTNWPSVAQNVLPFAVGAGLVPIFGRAVAMRAGLGLAGLAAVGPGGALSTGDVLQDLNDLGIYNPEEVNAMLPYVVGAVALDFGSDVLGVLGVTGLGRSASSAVLNKVFAGRAEREAAKQALFRMAEAAGGVSADTVAGAAARVSLGMQARQVLANGAGFFGKATEKYLLPGMGAFMTELWTERAQEDLAMQLANYASSPAIQGKSAWESTKDLAKAWVDKGFNPRNILPWGDETMFVQDANGAIYPQRLQRHRLLSAGLLGGLMGGGTHTIVTGIQDLAGFTPERAIRDMSEKLQILDKDGNPVLGQAEKRRRGMAERLFAVLQQKNQGVTEQSVIGIDIENNGGNVIASFNGHTGTGSNAAEAYMDLSQQANEGKQQIDTRTIEQVPGVGWRAKLANGEEILVKGTNAENTLRDLVKNHNNDNHPLVISRGFTAERGLGGAHPWTITRADGFTVRAESLYDNYVFHDFAWNPANNIVMDSLVRRIPANEAEQRIALDFTQTGAINFKGQMNAIRQAIANSNGRLELIKHPNAKRNALFTNTEMRVADTRFGIVYDITLNKRATNSNATVTVTGMTFTGNRVQLDSNVATQTLRSAANRGALNTEIVLRAPTAGLNITPVQSPDQTSWRFDTEEVDRIAAMAGAQIRQQTPNRVDMSIPAIAEGVQIQVPFSIRVDENGVVFVEANGQSIQVDGINDRYLGANEAQRTAQNARSILQVQALQGGEYEVVSRNQSTGEMRVRRTTNTGTTVEFILDKMGQYVEDSLEVVAAPPASLNRLQQMIDDGINRQRARTSAQRQTQQGLGQLRDPDLHIYTDAELINLGLDPATIRDRLQRMFVDRIRPAAFRSSSFEEFEEELLRLGFPKGRFIYRSYTDGTGLSLGKWMVRDRDDVQFGAYDDTAQGFRNFANSLTEENIESLFDIPDIVPYLLEHLAENNPGRATLLFSDDEYQKVISKYLDYYDRVFRQEAQVQGVPLSTERRQEIETRIQQQIDDLLRGQLRLVSVQEVLRLYGGLIVRGWAVEDPATNSFMDRNGNLVKERDNMDAFFDDLMSIPMNLVPANHNVVEIYRLNDTLYGYDELIEAGNNIDNINLITSTQNNRFEELVQEQINGYIEKPSQRARRGDRRYIDRLNSYIREKLQQVNVITDLGELVRFYMTAGLNMKRYATFRVEDNGVWMFLGKDGKRYTAATVKNNKSVAAITKWYEDETISPTKFAQSFKIGQVGYTLTQEDGTLVFDYKFAITNKDGNELTQGQILSGQSQMMNEFKKSSVVFNAFDNFKTNDFINDELIREANSEGIVNAKDEGVIRTELIAELKTRLDNSNLLSDFQNVYGSQLQVRYGFRNLTPGNNYGKYFGTNGMKDMMGVDTFLTQEQAVAINDIWANNRANTEITVYYVFYNKEGTVIYTHSREEHLDALMIQLRSTQNLERIDLDAEIQTRVEESRRAAGLANARNQELRRQRQQVAGASLAQAQSTPTPSIPATTSSADQYLHSLLGDTGLANITNLVYPFTLEYLQITKNMRDAYYATFVGSKARDLNNSEHDLDAELMRLAGNLYKNAKKNGIVELYQTAIEFFNANQNARNSVLTEHAIEELRKTIQVTRRDVNFALGLRRENRPLTAEQQGWVDEVDRIINGLSQGEREAIYKRQGVQGYWDSEAGHVILVAESIPLNHAHRVFAHELRVHATAHMTDDLAQNWINIADFLKSQMGQNTEVGRALDRIYRFRAIQFDETRWSFWEEMAAYFVEDYEGRIPFTANIKAHFRHWFRRSGIFKGNDDITAADIVVFAKAAGSYAINHHEQMKQPTEGIPAQGEFFSRLGTAFSVPENVARTEFEAVRNHYGSAERNVLMGSTFDRDTGMYQESNLNDAHWTLVRTPFYKKWFGDWEMNPNTASKIVDTNGEPLIVVHNTQHDYSAYDAPFIGNNGFFGHNGQYVYGKVGENLYNRRFSDRPRKALFLNVRNPLPLHNYELMAPIMERLGYEESAKRLDLWALSDSVRSNLPLRNLLESIAGFAEDTDVDTSLADYLVLNDNNITSSFPGATFDEAHRFIVGLYEAATTPANSILTNDPVVDSESIGVYAESIEDEATLTHLDAAAKVFDRRLEGFENQMLRLAYNPDGYFTSLDAHHGDLSIVTQEPITDILSAINQRALILGEEDMLEFKSAVVAAYDEILALENVSTLQGNEAFMNLFNLALHKMRLDEVSFRLGDGLTFRTEAAYPVPTTQSLLKEHNRRLAENMKSLMIREGFDGIAGTDDILLVHPDQAKDAYGFLNPFPSVNSRRTQGVTSTRMEETVMGLLNDAITKDAHTLNVEPVRLRSEYRSIYRANFVDQPWMQSNLDEYSWIMARTPSFKQHYGEWQHDPTPEMNLDYRGEPVRESGGFIAPDRIVAIQNLEQVKANNIGFYFSRISGAALQRLASHNGDIRLAESESVALEMARRGYDKADIKFATGWEEQDGRWAYDLSNYGATVISKDELTEVQKELKERGDRHASRKGAIESARRHIEDMIILRVTNREDKLINDIEKEFTVAFDNYVNRGEVSWNDFSIEELKLELLEYIKDTVENNLGSNLLLFHSFFNSSYSDTLNDWLDSFEAYLFGETDYIFFIRTVNEIPINSTITEVIDDIFNYRTMDDSVAQAFHYLKDNDFILDSHIQKLENLGQTWRDESLFAPVSFIEQLKLPHVFKQEELFIAYPFLRNVDITVEDTGTSRAWATPTMNKITFRRDYFESWPSSEGDLVEVFVHEIQHLIQYREGWPGGTSHDALLVGDYLHRLAQVDREFLVKTKDLFGRILIIAEDFIDRLAQNNIVVPGISHLENPYNILREYLGVYKTFSESEFRLQRELTYNSLLNFNNSNERLRYLLGKVTSFDPVEIRTLPDSLFRGLFTGNVVNDFIRAGMTYREAKDAPYNYYWLNEGEWEARYTDKHARLTQEELNEVLLNDYMDSNSYYTAVYQGVTASRRTVHNMTPEEYLNLVLPYTNTGNKTIVNSAYFSSISPEALERMRGDRKTVNLDALKAQDKELEQLILDKAAAESALIVAQNERQIVEDLLTKTNEEIAQLEQTQAKKKLTKKQREKYDALIQERNARLNELSNLRRHNQTLALQVQDAENRIEQLLNDPNYIDNVKKVNEEHIRDINDRKTAFIRDRANERVTLILRMGDINIILRDNPDLEQDAVNTLVNQRSAIFTQVNDVRDQAIQEVARMDDEVTRIITNDPMTQRQRDLELAQAARQSLEERIDAIEERIQEITDEANLRAKGMGEKALKQIQVLQAQLVGLQTQLAEAQTREQGFEGEFTKLDQILAQKLDTLNQLAQMDGEIAAEQMEQAGKDVATILLVTGFERDKSGKWWYRGSNVNGKFRSPVDILYNLMEEIYALAGKKVPKRYSDAYAEFQTLQIEREREVQDALKSGQKVSATQFKLYGQKQLQLVTLFKNFFFVDMKKFSLNTPFEKFLAGINDANVRDQIKQLRNNVVRSGFVEKDKGYLTLKDVYEDDDLYNAYPFLRDLRITFWNDGKQGWFKPGTTSYSAQINISPIMIAGTFRQALLHEIQHAIQWYEGLFYSYGNNLVYGADLSELQSHMVEFTSLIPEEDVRTITTEDFITNFFTDYTNGSVTLGNVETDWARPGSIFVPYVPNTGAPFAPLNAPSTVPQGLQKQENVQYPDFTEAQVSAYFSLSKRTREEAIAQMRKPREGRPDLTEEQMNIILDELDKYDDRKKQLLTLKWILNGSIAMPIRGQQYEDEYKVDEAIKLASMNKVDPFKYESPVAILNEYMEFHPDSLPINPEIFPEIVRDSRIDHGDGIVSYEITDTREGQETARKIINSHLGKGWSNWCLTRANTQGELQQPDSWEMWKHYNGLPKRMAFKNGKLISFMATSAGYDIRSAFDLMLDTIKDEPEFMSNYTHVTDIRNMIEITDARRGIKRLTANRFDVWMFRNALMSKNDKIVKALRYFPEERVNELRNLQSLEDWSRYVQANFEELKREMIDADDNIRSQWLQFKRYYEELIEDPKSFRIEKSEDETTAFIVTGDGKRVNIPYDPDYQVDFTADFIYDAEKDDYFAKPQEQWWDTKDISHPDLDWARGTMEGYTPRYSAINPNQVIGYFSRIDTDLFTPLSSQMNASDLVNEDDTVSASDLGFFSKITNKELIDRLDAEPKVYDGKLYRMVVKTETQETPESPAKTVYYPVMATRIGGTPTNPVFSEPIPYGEWEQADERPELIFINNKGKYKYPLMKDDGGVVDADYAPYTHSSTYPLNDQFTTAYKRPNLVVLRVEVPQSEIDNPYTAIFERDGKVHNAPNSTGIVEWNKGTVTKNLGRSRTVILSRYSKAVEELSDADVADIIVPDLKAAGVGVPINVVTPGLLRELVRRGVEILDPVGFKLKYERQRAEHERLARIAESIRNEGIDSRYFSRTIPAEPGTVEYTTAYFARLTDFDENTVMRGVLSKYRNDKTRFVIPVEERDDRTIIDIIPTLTESMDRIRTKDRDEILQQMRNALNPYIYFWRKKTEDLEFIVSPHNALTVFRDLIVNDPNDAEEIAENAKVAFRKNPEDYSQEELNKLVPHVQHYLKNQRDSIVRGWIYGIMADFPGQPEYEYLIWRSLNLNLSKDKYMLPAEYDDTHAKEAFKRFAQDKTYPDFYTLYIDTKIRFVESNSDEVIEITDNKGRVIKKWIKIAGTGISLNDNIPDMLPGKDELSYEYKDNINAVMTAAFATKWCVSYRENAEHVLIEDGNDFWVLYDYQKKRPLLAFVPVREEEELRDNYQYTGIFNRSDPTDNSVPFDLRNDVRILAEQARDKHAKQTLDWLGNTWMDNQKRLERLERHISDSISYRLTKDDIQMISEATSIPIRYDENTGKVVAEYLDENMFSDLSDMLQYKILDRINRVIGDIKLTSINSVGIEEIYGNLEVSTYAMIPNLKFIEGNIKVGDNSSFNNLVYVGGDIIAGNKFSAKKLYSHHGNIQIGENAVLPYEFRFRSRIEESPYLFSGHQQFVFDQFNARTGLNLYINDQGEVALDTIDTTSSFFNDLKNQPLIDLLYRSVEVIGASKGYSNVYINNGTFPRLKRIIRGIGDIRLARDANFPNLVEVIGNVDIDGKVNLPNLLYIDGSLYIRQSNIGSPNLPNLMLVTGEIINNQDNLSLPNLRYVGDVIMGSKINVQPNLQQHLNDQDLHQAKIETRAILNERSNNAYFSRTGSPLGNVTNYNTDIYDRTPIPGAPGAYKLRNGQIFINPDEVADEHVARNILYALIRENKQAMENKNIAAIIDTIKGWENSADTRERNFWATIANNIHLAGLSGDKPIIAYAAREFLNQHIDARNPQGTNTIEGVFAALLNEIPEIIGQVANTSTSNVNAMPSDIITVTNALGEVQNDTIEVAVPGLQITERDLEITQRRIMAPQFMEGVMEDIKRLIDTYEDADFQFIKGQGWLRYGDMMWNIGSNLLGMRNIVDQIMHGTIDYGNYDMTDTTDEEANTPRSAFRDFVQRLPKDSPLRNQATKPDVEEFLRVFPAYIRDRIKVAYSREPEWEELFGKEKNGIYKPYLADREIIFIKAYDRTLADVVGTISYLVSRFGWTMWNNSDFAPLMDELYTVLKHNIKEELPSFFEKLQGNPPTPSEKSALVSAFISHMGGTVYELEYFAKKSSFVPSAEEQKVMDIGKRFREKIKNLELTISKTFARDFAENEEITKEYVEKLLRLTMAPVSGQGLFFAYDVDHDNLRQYDGSIPSSMQKWENLSHVTVFGNDYGPLYQAIPSSEDALTNMYMANRFRNASPYWRNVYKWWWRNRHPPMKRPGDTILGLENTVMLGRAFKAVTQEFGLALKNIYKNVTALKDELMRKGIDTDEFTEAKGYEQELRDRGITDEKLLEKAKITDTFLRYGHQRVLENVIEIRALVRYTSQRLEYWMRQENVLSRDIQKMHAEMERFANRFVSDWDHRKYQAYTEDGQNDLHEMRTIVNAARVTSERWYSDIVEQNKTDLSNLEKKKQTGQIDEKTYAKERKKLRHAIKIHERLDALFHWAMQDEMSQLPVQGSPGYDQRLSNVLGASRQAMINKIDEIMREVETYKERGVIGKMDLIPGARKRTLNENDPHDFLEITFLDPVKDPALQLIFNLDQQGKITDKLIFNLRFGENLLAGGIATIKGSTETTPIRVDNLSWLENGTFLRYVQVDPFFMDEISNEVKLQDYIRQNIFGEIIATAKQNLTILNWRMAISNYIGNISNLILTGEIFRIQNLRKGMRLAKDKWWNLFLIDYNKSVEKIPEKVFAKSINEASAEYNELIKMYQHEMDKLNIWGSGISSAEITMYGQGGWEKHVDLIAAAFQTASEMAGKETFDEVTRRKWQRAAHSFMRGAREFYGFGDEWVKPLTYLNNRAVALAKYRALHNWSRYEGFENTPEAEQINEQIMDAATREAALLTFKETTTWELSPDIVRQLARTRVRVLTPDFLLHAFQMVRIYATNLYRTKEVAEEMARLRAKGKENLNPYEEAYLSLLRNEFWRRTAGQGIYTWIAAELATYGGSSLAWIFGSFAAFLSGSGGDDDEKRKKRKEEREKSPHSMTFDEHVGMSMLLTGISQVGNLFMPLMWVPGKVGHEFYAYNGQRAHAALTITPVTPPTTDPSWLERFNIILRQIVNYDSDPLSLQIANIVRQKNSFGQKITGKEQLFEMLGLLTPQVIQQGINIGRGTNELMTGTEELPWRERKRHRELAIFDVAGFKVQRVSVDDNIENLGRMIDNLASTGRNPYRRAFFKKLENNLDMDESAIKSAVDDILSVNERDMGRIRWILESFRKMGIEKKRLESHLAAARNTGSTILGKQYVGQLLAGRNVLNSLLLTSLNEKISSAEKLREGTDFPPNERRKVIDNYRRAMRMIQGADL